MKKRWKSPPELSTQLKWVIISRVLFALIIIVSSLIFTISENLSFFSQPFLFIYNTAGLMLIVSIIYIVWLNNFKNKLLLAYFQTVFDTLIVSFLIFLTGGYNSIFTFLYLVVIIYTSMVLQKGSLLVAAVSSILYGTLIELEYYNKITPYLSDFFLSSSVNEAHIIFRIVIFTSAAFAVSILSGILAAQLRGARQDLKITQEHLKRVEKMAAMDEMVSGIAHEVKNPLASLSGSIQLLHEDTTPGSYEDKLMQIILRETDRLKQIVNDIRFFSKPNTENARETNLSTAIDEIIELFLKDPEYKDRIFIERNLEPDIYQNIDPAHFRQILWNLMKNSAQAITGAGSIAIELTRAAGNRVYLTIEDNGCGIEKEQVSHIFDPFYTTKPEGTGLGLSIIHRLVDTYNGVIDFESTPGKGSIFTVLLHSARSTPTR